MKTIIPIAGILPLILSAASCNDKKEMRRGESLMIIDTRLLKIGAKIKLKRSWKLHQPISLAEVKTIDAVIGQNRLCSE